MESAGENDLGTGVGAIEKLLRYWVNKLLWGHLLLLNNLNAGKLAGQWLSGVREMTIKLPKTEFDLKDNISRAARSTTRNIAEGFGRFHYQENIQFCRIASGSLFEIIDDAITMFEEKYISVEEYTTGRNEIDYSIKVLNGYLQYLQNRRMLRSKNADLIT